MIEPTKTNINLLVGGIGLLSIVNFLIIVYCLATQTDRTCLITLVLMPFTYIILVCVIEIVDNIKKSYNEKRKKYD